ncbi:MAG TPA: ribonuclease M5 [Desulfobacteria bacterium]|nr:ribonuclease M5 [Desulfobacteria bacterium]
MQIEEVIVVEGKDDIAAVKRAVKAEVIATSGFGFGEGLIRLLNQMVNRTGVIVFTDPDSAGNLIRRRINTAVPGCKNAYLPRLDGIKGNNVGIENASSEAICRALERARATAGKNRNEFSMYELINYGLAGGYGAEARRKKVGNLLGIGETNSKQFLTRLNNLGITKAELLAAVDSLGED